MDHLCITVPCILRFRDSVGALIQHICQQLESDGAEPGLGYQVVSAFNEAFNNLVQYAYPQPSGGLVEVHLELAPEQIVVELRDTGAIFEFENVEAPDLNDLPESGLGIYIIKSFMTEVIYRPGGDREQNKLRMIRTLAGGRDPTAQGTNIDA